MSPIRRISLVLVGLVSALCLTFPAFAENKTQIRLLLSVESARPGDVIWAGLEMDMPKTWHTYWRNGGDAGEPTTIKWTLPDGVTAGDINWPLPAKEIDAAGDSSLVTYIYTNQIVLPVQLTLDKSLKPGPVTVTATAKWMECSDICVFGGGDATASLTIGDTAKPSANAALIAQWQSKVPQPDTAKSAEAFWDAATPATEPTRGLFIDWKTNAAPADFYPYANTNFDLQGQTETVPGAAGTIRLRKIIKKGEGDWPKQIDGVIVGKAGLPDAFGLEEHFEIQAGAPASAPQISAPKQSEFLIPKLLAAFLGGLILNIMPCVLPVIALKVLGFVNQSKEEPRRVRKLGLVYGAGVLMSFVILAVLAIGAQRAGGVASWGDLFRNPHFQVAMTILMMLIALNLFGVFEITLSGAAMGAANEWSGRPGMSGAFFNGVLATLLATPCTAPFLGPALGFALTQPPAIVILVFLAAGMGLAVPFALLCYFPQALKLLPRPGAWMEKFKNLMGFPMLATAVWLMWISSTAENDQLWFGLFLVVLGLAAWLWGQFVQRGGGAGKIAAMIICLILVVAGYEGILKPHFHEKADIDWKVWSPEAVEAARRAGHPVFVDFTAKSCLTCNINLGTSIDIPDTRTKLKELGAVTFKADDTLDDPAIARELRRYNTSGVPLVLVYSKDVSQPPEVLPAVLTPSIVLAALDKVSKE